jgi:multidrug efflux pump subunit AcrB
MILSDVSVRRPVFAMVMSLLLTIIGLMAASRLSVRETPNVQPPIVSIDTVYTGASASVVESKITQVIENQIAGLEGVDTTATSNLPPMTCATASRACSTTCPRRPIRPRCRRSTPLPTRSCG